ncbi:MAG: metallophosphoesterase [Clostridiales bacterium]|nr:metallophosphoesterase [Clostridiales bacterium]
MIEITTYEMGAPCRIAFLSDTHNNKWEPIAKATHSLRPDVICIAGDIFGGNRRSSIAEQKNILPLLRACCDMAPVFCSIGNHEWFMTSEDMDVIRGLGVCLLDNSWTAWQGAGRGADQGMIIGGFTSELTQSSRICRARGESFHFLDLTEEMNGWLDGFEAQEGYKLLLCHHPEYYPKYLEGRGLDLVLSGHAHGGQWRFFGRGVLSPGQGLFPKLTSGIHGNMVISRGLSNGTIVPRINNPIEVICIE